MTITGDIIDMAFRKYRPAVAFSGGGDSMVVLDLCLRRGHKPPLVYVDTQMEWNSSQPYVADFAKRNGLELHIAKAEMTPLEVWQRYGFPMLGKMPARMWMRTHPAKDYGFKVDCSTCCRKIKIEPGRLKAKEIGCNAMLSGLRGNADDRLRGLRSIKDGAVIYLKQDQLTQINPIDGWTDSMVRRYTKRHKLEINPIKAAGMSSVGCRYCGGGSRYVDNTIRFLRHHDPADWRHLMTDLGHARTILAIKYDAPLEVIDAAIDKLGGLGRMLDAMPHVFDFLQFPPLSIDGYDK